MAGEQKGISEGKLAGRQTQGPGGGRVAGGRTQDTSRGKMTDEEHNAEPWAAKESQKKAE